MKNGVKVALTVITGVVVFFLSTRFIFVIPSYGGHKAFMESYWLLRQSV